jgi:hypothetical protein
MRGIGHMIVMMRIRCYWNIGRFAGRFMVVVEGVRGMATMAKMAVLLLPGWNLA